MTASAHDFLGPILITVALIGLYYVFMVRIAILKRTLASEYREKGEKFDRYFGQDRRMLSADRAQLNLLEHMPPFLTLMWLNAVFVSPTVATTAGAVYVVTRMAHPLAMGRRLGRDVRLSILAVTGPGYLVIVFFVVSLLVAALS